MHLSAFPPLFPSLTHAQVKGNVFKNKRVLIEAVHRQKAEKVRWQSSESLQGAYRECTCCCWGLLPAEKKLHTLRVHCVSLNGSGCTPVAACFLLCLRRREGCTLQRTLTH